MVGKIAEQSDAKALYWLGSRYLNSDEETNIKPGITYASTTAVKWLTKAIDKGNMDAAISLSVCYVEGRGVAKNEEKRRELLTIAAEKENAEA